MYFVDWLVVAAVLVALFVVGIISRRYMKSVADFLVAGRGIGRFLGQTTSFAAGVGAVSIVAEMEAVYAGGWAYFWSRISSLVILMVIGISGFGIYRLRETKVMTINELFERRYSRKLRIFCGMLCFFSGILNMAIFPYTAAKFFLHFLSLPMAVSILGLSIPTFALIMLFILIISVWLSFVGGQVTLMATDYLQGAIMLVMTVLVGFVVYRVINMGDINQAVMAFEQPMQKVNPFRSSGAFGVSFILMHMFLSLFGGFAWAPNAIRSQGARNPKEAKLIYLFGLTRGSVIGVALFAFVPMAAFACMHLPAFADKAESILAVVSQIPNEKDATQQIVPLFLKSVFPIGMTGLFVASMFAASISTHDSYLLSWAGVLIQDVIIPIRKKPLSKDVHIRWLRWATIGVAVFIFVFSLFYKPVDYIVMFMFATGAIYAAGASVIILGALYWRRATTAGAWAAMITGATIATSGVILKQIWTKLPEFTWKILPFLDKYQDQCPFTGMQVSFVAMVTTMIMFVVVSLVSKGQGFDLDALLHRKKELSE